MPLIISPAQLDAFAPTADLMLGARVAAWIKATWPSVAARHGAGLAGIIVASLPDARRVGLAGECDLAAYAAIGAAYGAAWSAQPPFPDLLSSDDRPATHVLAWLLLRHPEAFSGIRSSE